MPIIIKIEAHTPAELAEWLGAFPALKAGVVLPAEPALAAVNDALAAALADTPAAAMVENRSAVEPIRDLPKPRRGRPPKDEPAPAPANDPVGPDEAAQLVHEHVPAEQKAAEPTGEVFDIDTCKAVMRELAAKQGTNGPQSLLAEFNVVRISALDPSQHKAFVLAGRQKLVG